MLTDFLYTTLRLKSILNFKHIVENVVKSEIFVIGTMLNPTQTCVPLISMHTLKSASA